MVSGRTRQRLFVGTLVIALAATTTFAVTTASAQPSRRKKPPAAATKDPAPSTATPAGSKTHAAELFARSSDAYLHGDFATAIKLLDEAYAIDPQPVLVYNMARSHEGLGHTDEAIRLYEKYLAEDPSSSDRGAIQQRLATLKKQQEERQRLENEKAEVEAKRARQEQQQEQLEQREREVRSAPPSAAPAQPAKRSAMPYVIGGVGLAGIATGAVFGFFALDRESAGRDAGSLKDATEARDQGKTFAMVSNVAFIAGGAMLAGGVVWWVVDRREKRTTGSSSAPAVAGRSLNAAFGPGSVSLHGEF